VALIPELGRGHEKGIAGLALGTAAAVVATPFAFPSGSMGEVGRTLIEGPYDFTFLRPLGVW
jgi:hypothetical protein